MHQLAFFDGNGDVGALAGLVRLEHGYMHTLAAGVAQRDRVIEDASRKVTFVLIELPDAFLVFLELGGIVGLGKDILEEDRMRNTDRMQVLHRPDHDQVAENRISLNFDFAHFHLRPFIHVEGYLERGRWDLSDFRIDGRELASSLRQIFLEDHRGALNFIRVVLRLNR